MQPLVLCKLQLFFNSTNWRRVKFVFCFGVFTGGGAAGSSRRPGVGAAEVRGPYRRRRRRGAKGAAPQRRHRLRGGVAQDRRPARGGQSLSLLSRPRNPIVTQSVVQSLLIRPDSVCCAEERDVEYLSRGRRSITQTQYSRSKYSRWSGSIRTQLELRSAVVIFWVPPGICAGFASVILRLGSQSSYLFTLPIARRLFSRL